MKISLFTSTSVLCFLALALLLSSSEPVFAGRAPIVGIDHPFLRSSSDISKIRDLQSADRPCNEIIGTVTVADIQATVQFWIALLFPGQETSEDAQAVAAVFAGPIKYNVLASKVCGSCADFASSSSSAVFSEQYCSPDAYGYEAVYSTLVFHPIDPATENPVAAKLQGSMTLQGTRLFENDAATIDFPDNITDAIVNGDGADTYGALIDTFNSLLAASAGTTSVMPDYIGTGASQDEYDRTYLTRFPTEQAAVVTWKAAQQYTKAATNGCTELNDFVTVTGYSLGGLNALFASTALEAIGVEVHQVFSQAGPYDVNLVLYGGTVENLITYGNSTIPVEQANLLAFVAFIAAAYSNENADFLPNAGTNQTLASPEFLDDQDPFKDVRDWFFGEDALSVEELIARLPLDDFASLLHPNYFALVAAAAADGDMASLPCVDYTSDETSLLCQALLENSAVPILQTAEFPIQWCHSEEDDVVSYTISELLIPTDRDNIQQYDPPLESLAPRGSHGTANQLCNSAIAHFFMTDNGNFNAMVPITENAQGDTCASEPPVTPTQSPNTDPNSSGTGAGRPKLVAAYLVTLLLSLISFQ